MGGATSSVKRVLGCQREEKSFLMVGLDAAGKTSILYKLQPGKVEMTIPTIAFNVETVEYAASRSIVSFTAWDVGGRSPMRALWRHWYEKTNALIFVVDSNDRDRLEEAKDQLQMMLEEVELAGKPLLVFANKQDLPGAMPASQLTSALHLDALRDRQWFVQGCSVTTGDGLHEGLDWLTEVLRGEQGRRAALQETADAVMQPPAIQESPNTALVPRVGRQVEAINTKGSSDVLSAAETESTADTEPMDEDVQQTEGFII